MVFLRDEFIKAVRESELIFVPLLPQTALPGEVWCFRTKLVITLKCKIQQICQFFAEFPWSELPFLLTDS